MSEAFIGPLTVPHMSANALKVSGAFTGLCLLPVCGVCIVAHRWFILSEDLSFFNKKIQNKKRRTKNHGGMIKS
jgi:hypothetical protein